MVRGKKEKAAVLVLTAVCIILCLCVPTELLAHIGIAKDAMLWQRLAYPFFHASLAHTLINCWCLLSIVFMYDVSAAYLIIAYLIAVTYPVNTVCSFQYLIFNVQYSIPTVGLSAVCFALLGMVSFQAKRKLFFHFWILSFFALSEITARLLSAYGYDITPPNNTLHLYSYVVGLMVGFLNSPMP